MLWFMPFKVEQAVWEISVIDSVFLVSESFYLKPDSENLVTC